MNARLETEKQLLAILVLHNEMFEVLQIKPTYLSTEINQQLLTALINSYQKKGAIVPNELLEDNVNLIEYIVEIYNTTLISKNWKNTFFALQNDIFEYYKNDVVNQLQSQLKAGKINYETFISKISKLKDIQLIQEIKPITQQELIECSKAQNMGIEIKKYPRLNETLKLVRGDLVIIGAMTGTGKSGLLLNFMDGLMDEYQCIYFNMEMSISTIYKRMISIRSNVPINFLDNPSTYQQELITKSTTEIEKNQVYVEHKATDITSIKSFIQRVKNQDKHTIVFLDHVGLIKGDKKSIYEQTTEVAKQLRQICLDYDCTIICASQLSRSAYSSEEITLSMLKDSGELENSASKVILLYRDRKCPNDKPIVDMYLEIAKNRDGQVGIIKAKYDKTKQIFTEG